MSVSEKLHIDLKGNTLFSITDRNRNLGVIKQMISITSLLIWYSWLVNLWYGGVSDFLWMNEKKKEGQQYGSISCFLEKDYIIQNTRTLLMEIYHWNEELAVYPSSLFVYYRM